MLQKGVGQAQAEDFVEDIEAFEVDEQFEHVDFWDAEDSRNVENAVDVVDVENEVIIASEAEAYNKEDRAKDRKMDTNKLFNGLFSYLFHFYGHRFLCQDAFRRDFNKLGKHKDYNSKVEAFLCKHRQVICNSKPEELGSC